MPRPDDIKHILDPKFRAFDGWDFEFGQFRWFYLAGFVEVMAKAEFRRRNKNLTILTDHRDDLGKDVPAMWKKFYSATDYAEDWKSLSSTQIEFCVRRQPLKFAKAAMSCVCLERAVDAQKVDIDIYDWLQIRPAVFYIYGFPEIFSTLINQKEFDREALRIHTLQEKFTVFRAMASGYTVTYQTAKLTLEYLKLKHPNEAAGLSIEHITERTERQTEKKQPADEENIVRLKSLDASDT